METNSSDVDDNRFTHFEYELTFGNCHKKISENIQISHNQPIINETTHYIIRKYGLLPQHFNDIFKSLKIFAENQQKAYKQKLHQKSMTLVGDDNFVDVLAHKYKKHYKNFMEEDISGSTNIFHDEANFAEIYTKLIESDVHEIMIKLEASYALFLEKNRQKFMNELDLLNGKINEATLKQLPILNTLLNEKIDLKNAWKENITTLKLTQKKEYLQWIMDTFGSLQTNTNVKHNVTLSPEFNNLLTTNDNDTNVITTHESFTVYLGHQHKTNINICIVTCNFIDYYSAFEYRKFESLIHNYNMYTSNATASILIVDQNIPSSYGYSKIFNNEVVKLTEFHFQQPSKQINRIKNYLETNNLNLNEGDVYITRHSTFMNFHICFHVVVNQEGFIDTPIASSTPVMQAIANILSYCLKNGCGNIDIPLLLTSLSNSKSTIDETHLLRRCESLLKCIKGFLIHSCMWENETPKPTIRFLIPKYYSSQFINSIVHMIPIIYTVK